VPIALTFPIALTCRSRWRAVRADVPFAL